MSKLEEGIYGSTSGGRKGSRGDSGITGPYASSDCQINTTSSLINLAAQIPTLYPMISETRISNIALVRWADLQFATATPIGMDSPSMVVRFFRFSTLTAPGKHVVLVAPEVRERLSAIRTHASNLSRDMQDLKHHDSYNQRTCSLPVFLPLFGPNASSSRAKFECNQTRIGTTVWKKTEDEAWSKRQQASGGQANSANRIVAPNQTDYNLEPIVTTCSESWDLWLSRMM